MEKDLHLILEDENSIVIKKVQKKGKADKYEITYIKDSNEEKIILLEDQVVNFRILKNKEYTLGEWKKIIESYNMSLWFTKSINYISFKMRTTKEIKDYLTKNEVVDKHIKEIIDRLTKMKLLDDERYAYDFLDEVIRKKKGLKYFKFKLSNVGINAKIIEKVALDYPMDTMYEELLPLIKKQQVKLYTYPINYQKQKLTEKLLRDGFEHSMVSSIINKVQFTCDIKDRIKKDIEKIQTKTVDKQKITNKLLQKGYSYQDIKTYLEK